MKFAYIFPIAALTCILLYASYYFGLLRYRSKKEKAANLTGALSPDFLPPSEAVLSAGSEEKPGGFLRLHRMEKSDRLPILVITAIYAVVQFTGLGSTNTPQSFHRITSNQSVVLDLGDEYPIGKVAYYTGLEVGSYSVSISTDGEDWVYKGWIDQNYASLFRWCYSEDLTGTNARYVRLNARCNNFMELGEVAVIDPNGNIINPVASSDAPALCDEPSTARATYTYMEGSHFDEIYHARTAYEYITGSPVYETTHPPLGKIFIAAGISIFGMNPFGWRFAGALFGVLMVPAIYIFIKNIFGKTSVATLGTLVFSFDFMHFVQTRIATIDVYGTFFTLMMCLFMYRFIARGDGSRFKDGALDLALSGICFGLGAASKWTCIYSGAGLAVVFFSYVIYRGIKAKRTENSGFVRWLILNIAWCLVFFVAIPVGIYYLSYIPFCACAGEELNFATVWANQEYMLKYHAEYVLGAEHAYSSRWWQWLMDIRPILYFLDTSVEGWRSSFGAFTNPISTWMGLFALLFLIWHAFKKRSGKAAFILAGFAAQFLPWVLIERTTFAYHYFPSVIFLTLAICFVMNDIEEYEPAKKRYNYIFAGGCIAVFAVFYPVLTGVFIPHWYQNTFLSWLPSWPF